MMPLTAAATRAALAALPNQIEVVPLQLKFAGVTFNPDDLYKILGHIGIPKLKTPVPNRRSFSAEFDANQQLQTNPGAEVNTTGWAVSAGTGTLARVTAGQLFGAGAFQHTAGGAPAANDGIANAAPGEALPISQQGLSPRVVATAFCKPLDASHTNMRFMLEERTAAGSVGFTIVTVPSCPQNVWTPVFAARQYGPTGVRVRVYMDHGANAPAAGQRFLLDGVATAVSDSGQDAQLTDASLNPDETANPSIVEIDLSLDQGMSMVPAALYDALDALYPVVASDKDSMSAQGSFSFLITP